MRGRELREAIVVSGGLYIRERIFPWCWVRFSLYIIYSLLSPSLSPTSPCNAILLLAFHRGIVILATSIRWDVDSPLLTQVPVWNVTQVLQIWLKWKCSEVIQSERNAYIKLQRLLIQNQAFFRDALDVATSTIIWCSSKVNVKLSKQIQLVDGQNL